MPYLATRRNSADALSLKYLKQQQERAGSGSDLSGALSVAVAPATDDHRPPVKRKSSLRLYGSSCSLPASPSPKAVRFGADVDVRYFSENETPLSVSASPIASEDEDERDSADEQDQDGPDDDEDTRTSTYRHPRRQLRLLRAARLCAQEPLVAKHILRFKKAMQHWQLAPVPVLAPNDAFDTQRRIFLERVFLSPDSKQVLGHVAVQNVAYAKTVTLRYSPDGWQSTTNVAATYSADAPRWLRKHGYERFVFVLDLAKLLCRFFDAQQQRSGNQNLQLQQPDQQPCFEFCLKLAAGGNEYWDNNGTRNYQLRFVQLDPHKGPADIHKRYQQQQQQTDKDQSLKKSQKFTKKSFSTSDLQDLAVGGLKENFNFNHSHNHHHLLPIDPCNNFQGQPQTAEDSPLRLSIDKLKSKSLHYYQNAEQELQKHIPGLASHVNELGNAFSDIKLTKDSHEGLDTAHADAEEPVEEDSYDGIVISSPKHMRTASTEEPCSDKQYQDIVEKFCFFQSPQKQKQKAYIKASMPPHMIYPSVCQHLQDEDEDAAEEAEAQEPKLKAPQQSQRQRQNEEQGDVSDTHSIDSTPDTHRPFFDPNPLAVNPQDYLMKHQNSSFGAFY